MQFDFFPSRQVSWYMVRLFLTRTLAVLAMLVVVLQMLDLLGNSGDILAYPGNGDAQLWHYVGLRAPQIVARFLPFSVLLGTLIMLAVRFTAEATLRDTVSALPVAVRRSVSRVLGLD